uniref:ZP domain-containing protein n=1 Tax=Leptobrachium leishanense TaxID=445787 RepID=A0A8C5M751_9ANUR
MQKILVIRFSIYLRIPLQLWPLIDPLLVLINDVSCTGVYRTECRNRFLWIWVEKDFLGPTWQLEVFNETGSTILLNDDTLSQCGYTKSRDVYGNVEVRVSVLGCYVGNVNDQKFDFRVQFNVHRRDQATQYLVSKSCSVSDPWNMREIVCEENYMEVSVIRIVPLDREWLKTDPQQTWPLVYGRLSQRWQVQFIVNNTLLTMSAADAFQRGYGVNATATRVVFRAPYQTLEVMTMKADGYRYEVILSIMYYSQALIRLIVNTTLACPTDPPIFTPTTLSWLSPAFLTPLVLDPSLYTPMSLSLGLNGQLISSNIITQNGYTFRHDKRTIEVTVPIGAPGGYTESEILNNTYGSTYRIHLFTDQEWSELPADITRHTVWKRIATPFQPMPPIFINYTIPESGYFNVSLGNFFPDVDLKSFIINKVPLTLTEAKNSGLVVHKVPNSNGTNAFFLQVPFSNPLVYLSGATRLYTLYVTYLMTLTPKDQDFTYAEVVECSLQDVVTPKYIGSCGTDRLILEMTHGNLDHYWVPYIRDLPLTRDLAQSQNYVTYQQGSVFHIEVPLFAVGLVYEDITLRGIVARLDWTLRDNKTLAILSRHSHTCRFPADRLLVCFPNGTVKATVLSLDTRPNFNPRKTHLKDQTCTPEEADDTRALFFFSVFSCGTTSQFDSDFLVYENEVTFEREVLLKNQPIISRDSTYRLTLRCRYPIRDSQRLYGKSKGLQSQRGFSVVYRNNQAKGDWSSRWLLIVKAYDSFASFYQPRDFPVAVRQDSGLYFEVDMHRKLPGFPQAMLQECWATPTSQMDDVAQWDLIVNGCAREDTTYSTTLALDQDSHPRFWVKIDGNASSQVIKIHSPVTLLQGPSTNFGPLCPLDLHPLPDIST